ncbi:MAG: hypothetical protein HC869_14095 [Rhodospirillales bacterium]|nr:hypothetical protein [Rhodospirillales bacterium]
MGRCSRFAQPAWSRCRRRTGRTGLSCRVYRILPPLILNFHSGISPIYNGSSTISFAFANGHPHLCGGTLMKMNAAVDGGEILAHYLPSVAAKDSPASLFMKTVGGAATLYERILDTCAAGLPLRSIPQPPPLFLLSVCALEPLSKSANRVQSEDQVGRKAPAS